MPQIGPPTGKKKKKVIVIKETFSVLTKTFRFPS